MSKNKRKHNRKSAGQAGATSESQQPAQKSAQRPAVRRTGLRTWCFRSAALLLSAALIVIVEVLLVTFGVGNELGLFFKVPGVPEILPWQVNLRAEESYFAGRQLAGPEPKRFDLPRPQGIYRIVVVGGSTVLGFPYPPELSFPRQLEILLNQQNSVERFEVINVGMVAINSFSVADVVKQSVAMQPDLIIVHTGHNEFYGPGGVASTTSMASLAVKFRRLRLFQLMASGFAAEPSDRKDLMEELPASVTIPRDGTLFRQAEKYYRENLEQIVATASAAKIPIVLTTVASNLSHHSPVSFHVPEQLATRDMDNWRAFFDRGRQLTVAQLWPEALGNLKQAEAISSDSSLLHYRMGQCLEALERYSESRMEFELARDIDGCRFRAPGSFRGIVRDVASETIQPNVFLFDSAEQLSVEAGPKALGSNLFLEHVHYNLDGHRRLALILGRFVQQHVLQRLWDDSRVPADEKLDKMLGLLQEDRVSGQSYALKVLNVFPMTKTFDVNVHRGEVVTKIKRELSLLDKGQQQVFADLSLDDMAIRLAEALGDYFLAKGQFDRELYYRRCDQIRRPWDPDVEFRLARCLAESDEHRNEAIECCRRTLQLDPQHNSAETLLIKLSAHPHTRK